VASLSEAAAGVREYYFCLQNENAECCDLRVV
jgi:hypothetical protein